VDFFAHQDLARRQTRRLVVLFILAVVAIVIAVNVVIAAASGGPAPDLFLWVSVVTLSIIAGGTLYRIRQLASGGKAIAEMVGARPVSSSSADLNERRLLNVVEEMAIASGIAVPSVYVMDDEKSINAFAAGYSPNEAVVAVTRGTLEQLTRDELQGVVAHEFSHILNGDMRMNIRLMGVLNGILVIGAIGLHMIRMLSEGRSSSSSSRDRDSGQLALAIFALGAALAAIGYVGVFFGRLIKAGVSRQREFLADASAVQFTRQPDGLSGALQKIATHGGGIAGRHAEDLSHMYFAQGIKVYLTGLFDTHPPLPERIQRVGGRRLSPEELAVMSPGTPAADEIAPGVSALSGSGWGHTPAAPAAAAVATSPAAVVGSIGNPSAQHVDYASQLLKSLPASLLETMRTPEGAQAAVLSLLVHTVPVVRERQKAAFAEAGDGALGESAFSLAVTIGALGRQYRLPLVDLAMPALKSLAQEKRDAFLKLVSGLIAADRRMTMEEFILESILTRRLHLDAGRAEQVKFNSAKEVGNESALLLSLIAFAGSTRGDAAGASAAFAKGAAKLGLPAAAIIAAKDIALDRVKNALDQLRMLAPLQKPAVVMACVETVLADNKVKVAEAELLRAICTVIDCPLPPVIGGAALPIAARGAT